MLGVLQLSCPLASLRRTYSLGRISLHFSLEVSQEVRGCACMKSLFRLYLALRHEDRVPWCEVLGGLRSLSSAI
jgi:hypothetical protein